jgi:protein-S-isoprenylcysteine O-methyltransferase Ste14
VTPLVASVALLALWAISWFIAALWSRRTVARPTFRQNVSNVVITAIGGVLFGFSLEWRLGLLRSRLAAPTFWSLPPAAGWIATGLVVAGLAFCWWARITLGDFWSGTVTRKENHMLIQAGPYRLVRHPIYTGLILALAATAVQVGLSGAVAGVGLMAVGFWLKARLEERFLAAGLGEAAYADYRRHTPMLIPFWPTPG